MKRKQVFMMMKHVLEIVTATEPAGTADMAAYTA